MAKKEKSIKVSVDDMVDFIWMSYRYCIGRHTIAAAYHAGTVSKYVNTTTPERREFMAKDIRREVSNILQFKTNFYTEGESTNNDAISILLKWILSNPIEFNSDFVSENKFTIDTNTGVVYIDPIELGEKRNSLYYDTLCVDIYDALPWIKLANYLDTLCHKYVDLNGEIKEVFPFYSFDKHTPELHWICCEQYESEPHISWYIAPDKLKFVDKPEV